MWQTNLTGFENLSGFDLLVLEMGEVLGIGYCPIQIGLYESVPSP